jgi:hypothetical protein
MSLEAGFVLNQEELRLKEPRQWEYTESKGKMNVPELRLCGYLNILDENVSQMN